MDLGNPLLKQVYPTGDFDPWEKGNEGGRKPVNTSPLKSGPFLGGGNHFLAQSGSSPVARKNLLATLTL